MRILLIEDDPNVAAAIAKNLKAESFAVDVGQDGVRGEELAKVNDYDVIILDRLLPRQDGRTTCVHLRRDNVLTPIIMLTALGDVEDRIEGLDSGADDYLAKPFHFGELLARIRSLARRGTTMILPKSSWLMRNGSRIHSRSSSYWRSSGTPGRTPAWQKK